MEFFEEVLIQGVARRAGLERGVVELAFDAFHQDAARRFAETVDLRHAQALFAQSDEYAVLAIEPEGLADQLALAAIHRDA